MHPNPLFRSKDRALLEKLIDDIGFGMVYLTTPDGPRVAHTPLLSDGNGTVQFHLARGNALTKHLDGATALIVVNGPGGYISPRWYDDRATVPTWDYVSLELEGRLRRLDSAELEAFLYSVIEKFEARLDGARWTAEETPADLWAGLMTGIEGFEMQIEEWRPTLKLSQKKSPVERERIAAGLEESGAASLAQVMRRLPI